MASSIVDSQVLSSYILFAITLNIFAIHRIFSSLIWQIHWIDSKSHKYSIKLIGCIEIYDFFFQKKKIQICLLYQMIFSICILHITCGYWHTIKQNPLIIHVVVLILFNRCNDFHKQKTVPNLRFFNFKFVVLNTLWTFKYCAENSHSIKTLTIIWTISNWKYTSAWNRKM